MYDELSRERAACGDLSVLVLCGGKGTRLRDVTFDAVPKALCPVGNRTLIDYSLQPFIDARVERILLLVAHYSEMLKKHFAQHSQTIAPAILFPHGETLSGVFPAIQLALREYTMTSPFVITDGDILRLGFNIETAFKSHLESHSLTTVIATSTPPKHVDQFHGARLDSIHNVLDIIDPPRLNSTNIVTLTGMIICNTEIAELVCAADGEQCKTWAHLYSFLYKLGGMKAFVHPFTYINANTPREIAQLARLIVV